MSIAFITLKMVFVLAWTIGDASSQSCQSLYQSCFVCRMSSGIVAQSKFNTIIRFWEVALVATVCLSWQIKWVKPSSSGDPTPTLVVWSSGNN
jgi:hypothetical protein